MDRKSEAELANLLAEAPGLPPVARQAVLSLPRLTGDASVLAGAEAVCLNATMMSALADLRSVAALLEAYGVARLREYDLAEVRDLDYYTGITFEGFAPGLGFGLISGGRYDDLIGHFGPPLPGGGLGADARPPAAGRELQGITEAEPRPDVLLGEARTARPAWAGPLRRAAGGSRWRWIRWGWGRRSCGKRPGCAGSPARPTTPVRTRSRSAMRSIPPGRTIPAGDWEEVERWRA